MNDARYLWTLANEMVGEISRWIREHEAKPFYARFKRKDMLRLTRLRVWSWRYCVDVEEILTLTLPYLRKSLSSDQKTRYGLGCSVAALTGRGNEKILAEALRQKYPGGEHRDIWRQRERERQIERERAEQEDGLPVRSRPVKGIYECDSVQAYLESYRSRVLREREAFRAVMRSPKRRRKHYRGNPFL